MKKSLLTTFLIIIFSCQNEKSLIYPKTKKINVISNYFDSEIIDPYRWLEDDRSDETERWVKKQNEVTFKYLNKIPYKNKLKERLEKLWNYEKVSAPFEEGEYTYFYKNDGLQDQYVVYRKDSNDVIETFINPNLFSKDKTTSLAGLSFSKSGKICAYSVSEGGSDWRKIIVMDVASKKIIEDTLVDIKFSGISWKNDEGFFYSSYDKPKGSELSDKTDQHKLYFHKLNTSQQDDVIFYGGIKEQKNRYVGGSVSEDGRFLFISASKSTSGNKLLVKDLLNDKSPLKSIIDNYDSDTYVLETINDDFFLVTNINAPNKKVVKTNFNNLSLNEWEEIIPNTKNVLNASSGGGFLFAEYMIDAFSQVYQYDFEGNKIRKINLPGIGSVGGFSGKINKKSLYFSFTNYHTPSSIYEYDIKTGNFDLYWSPKIDFNSTNYISKQVFYNSKDGTKVPMIITHKKGLELDGKNPTILYGYGGFNISLTPGFSVTNILWMEYGGVYAVPNIRGGGEYGKSWHIAGTQLNKQNVFDDFISAAEFLISEKYTSSDYLAIRGGSNGGLLVGATMTQRPDLMRVALPAVGVLDMLRYHTFTAGAGWAYDYGTSEDSEKMFKYLLGYSPVHNVKNGIKYPATLITTGDHDDRVVPAHSFKFAAELQDKQIGVSPTLIRIETNAGHGAGTPISKTIEQYADIYGFTFYNMGYEKLPN
ncbi:MAG: S9 family peptidase [Flavobacteriaceae bacterium]|nr:S9 family peptidase [Flavobacteriaceae bacterium]